MYKISINPSTREAKHEKSRQTRTGKWTHSKSLRTTAIATRKASLRKHVVLFTRSKMRRKDGEISITNNFKKKKVFIDSAAITLFFKQSSSPFY